MLRLIEHSWNLVAQNVVQDFSSAASGALHQMMLASNPATWLHAAKDIFGSKGKADRAEATRETQSTKSAAAVDLEDPAYSSIQLVSSHLAGLHVIINGSNGIDWEKARGDETMEDAGRDITFFARILQSSKENFIKIATDGEASVDLIRILDTSIRVSTPQLLRVAMCLTHQQIAFEVNDVVQNSHYMTSSYPANNSEKVKKWRIDYEAAYLKANFLASKARSIPGTPATAPPIAAPPSARQTAPIRSMQAQITLAASKDRLAMTQEMLATTQANYTKTTDMLLKQQQKLGEIHANLNRLSDSNVSLVSAHHSTAKKPECY